MKRTLIVLSALLASAFASADWRMIVRLKPGATVADANAAASSLGGSVVDTTPDAPFALLSLPSDSATYYLAQTAFGLGIFDVLWSGNDSSMRSAESIGRGATIGTWRTQQSVAAQNAPALGQIDWSEGLANSGGRTVRLAILDTGLSSAATDLWANVDASYDFFGGSANDVPANLDSSGDGVPDGAVGHGTMVAGVVNAVAPKVRLIIAKVADSDGRASAWALVKGLTFAANKGAEIANVSLGADAVVPAFSDVASWCRGKGMLVVAAIGNAGVAHAWYPASDPLSLCVTGVNTSDVKASFSNYDACAAVSANAVGVVSRFWNGDFAQWSGTSFASPFVSGAIADCLRRTTRRTPAGIVSAVRASGRRIDGANAPIFQGRIGGALDILALDQYLRANP